MTYLCLFQNKIYHFLPWKNNLRQLHSTTANNLWYIASLCLNFYPGFQSFPLEWLAPFLNQGASLLCFISNLFLFFFPPTLNLLPVIFFYNFLFSSVMTFFSCLYWFGFTVQYWIEMVMLDIFAFFSIHRRGCLVFQILTII